MLPIFLPIVAQTKTPTAAKITNGMKHLEIVHVGFSFYFHIEFTR